MAYRLYGEEPAAEGIKRIVSEQIDKAMSEIGDNELDHYETAHAVRKRCKKIRAVLRLVRPLFEDTYMIENARYRDAARGLSKFRDADALLECHTTLLDTFRAQINRSSFASIHRGLSRYKERTGNGQGELVRELKAVAERLREGRRCVGRWRLQAEGFSAVEGGLRKSYRRGRRAMRRAYSKPSDRNFHEWRKRAKYHPYHMRLLRDIWSPVMRSVWQEAKRLSDILGNDHDLAVLSQTLHDDPGNYGCKRDVQAFLGLMESRRAELQVEARTLGERVYAEKPKKFSRRMGCYWLA